MKRDTQSGGARNLRYPRPTVIDISDIVLGGSSWDRILTSITNQQTSQVPEEARARQQRGSDHHQQQRCDPHGDVVCADGEVRIRLVGADRFHGKQQENPNAGSHNWCVGVQKESFNEGVNKAGYCCEC